MTFNETFGGQILFVLSKLNYGRVRLFYDQSEFVRIIPQDDKNIENIHFTVIFCIWPNQLERDN
jgi:hypothetical protein